jgi:uncharacterized membrane protein
MTADLDIHWPELLITAFSFLLLFLYHVHLIRLVHRHPLATAVGITNHVRLKWVQSVMSERRDIMAVQTLRNLVMAATFLASTAVIISIGILSTAFRADGFSGISHVLNLFGSRHETLWFIKLMVLAVDFFFAFFNFTLAIRYYNHAGLMLNIPLNQGPTASVDAVTEVMNHAALHYTLGMRAYYLAIPFVLWLVGPLWLLAGALVLIGVMYRLDREA